MDFGLELVLAFWGMREELTAADKQLALDVAREASARAVKLLDAAAPAGGDAAGGAAEGASDEAPGYVASQLGGLACALFLNGERKAAIETIDRAIGMDGTSEELRGLRKLFAE